MAAVGSSSTCTSGSMIRAGTVIVPRHHFKKSFGFGADFGSSAIKLVYTEAEGENLIIHLVKFPLHHLEEAIEFTKETCSGKLEPGSTLHMSGGNVGLHMDTLEQALNVKIEIDMEMTTMISAFNFLAEVLPWNQFVYPPNLESREAGRRAGIGNVAGFFPNLYTPDYWEQQTVTSDVSTQIPADGEVHFPVLVCVLGSGHYIYKANGMHKKSTLVDLYTIAGKTFLGLSKLLLDVKGFDEAMTLAVAGDANTVDQSLAAAFTSENKEDVYREVLTAQRKLWSFGHVSKSNTNKEDVKREDIAAALVSMVTNSAAKDAFNWSRTYNIAQVFYVGGFVAGHQAIRDDLEREFFEMCYGNESGHAADCLFLQAGAHLSAIGSLLLNMGME